jgi:hypothetical protein
VRRGLVYATVHCSFCPLAYRPFVFLLLHCQLIQVTIQFVPVWGSPDFSLGNFDGKRTSASMSSMRQRSDKANRQAV